MMQPQLAPHPGPLLTHAGRGGPGLKTFEDKHKTATGFDRPARLLILRKFARDIPAVIGLVIVVFVIAIAIIGPWIAPYPGDVVASHLLQRLKPPSAGFPFGTDNLGRDIFSRVILGTRGALEVALAVVALAAAIGVPLGLIAGYTTSWLSDVIMRVTDVFLSLPQLILALALAQLLKPSLESAMLALALPTGRSSPALSLPRPDACASLFLSTRCRGSAPAPRVSCSRIYCPTRSRRSSCVRRSAWDLPSWSRRCSDSSEWAPHRPSRIGV
jgi:hypothetical protein